MSVKILQHAFDRIEEIKRELLLIGEMRPGSLSEQYNVCGQAACRCKDPDRPRRHGPYWHLSYTHKGRSRTEFIRKEQAEEVRRQIDTYAHFRALVEEWVDLSIYIARQKRRSARLEVVRQEKERES